MVVVQDAAAFRRLFFFRSHIIMSCLCVVQRGMSGAGLNMDSYEDALLQYSGLSPPSSCLSPPSP